MSDELEIYEGYKYKQKDEELDLREEDKGGGISPTYLEYPEPGRITEPKEVKSPRMGISRPSVGVLESEPIVPRDIHHAKKIGLLFMSYYKVPPNTALIISGGRRGTRVVTGSSTFVYPTEIAKELSLEIMAVDVFEEHIRTKDAIPLDIDAVVQFKVGDAEELIKIAARSFLDRPLRDIANMVREVLKGHLRDICASIGTKDIYFNRERLQKEVADASEPDLRKLGFTIKVFVIKDIGDPTGFFDYLATEKTVEEWRGAVFATAEARREAQIKVADTYQEAEERKAGALAKSKEYWKDTNVLMAEFDEEVAIKRAQADMAGPIETERKKIELTEQIKSVKQLEGEAEQVYTIESARGEAEAKRLIGEGTAKAEHAIAQAYSELDESGLVMNIIKELPTIVGEAAAPLNQLKDFKVIQVGDGGQGGAASPVVNTIQQIIASVLPLFATWGIDLKGMLGGKGELSEEGMHNLANAWSELDPKKQQDLAKELLTKVDKEALQEILTKGVETEKA
jgi:flotillin